LQQTEALDAAIAAIDAEVDAHLDSFRAAVRQLSTIPGVSALSAQVIVAEIGTDMSRFPSAGHLLSWAGLCPRNDESAGKRRSTRLRKGAPWLKATLIQCAWASTRKKTGYLKAQFLRLRARRGAKKAICAVAASMLTAAYHMLKDGTDYDDLRPRCDQRSKEAQTRRLVRRLADLGYAVEISPLPDAA
jgi:transposase